MTERDQAISKARKLLALARDSKFAGEKENSYNKAFEIIRNFDLNREEVDSANIQRDSKFWDIVSKKLNRTSCKPKQSPKSVEQEIYNEKEKAIKIELETFFQQMDSFSFACMNVHSYTNLEKLYILKLDLVWKAGKLYEKGFIKAETLKKIAILCRYLYNSAEDKILQLKKQETFENNEKSKNVQQKSPIINKEKAKSNNEFKIGCIFYFFFFLIIFLLGDEKLIIPIITISIIGFVFGLVAKFLSWLDG